MIYCRGRPVDAINTAMRKQQANSHPLVKLCKAEEQNITPNKRVC
jgi:hypothetical protein